MTEENKVEPESIRRPVRDLNPEKTARLIKGRKQNLRNYIDGLQLIKYLPNKLRYELIAGDVKAINTWLEDERYEPYINREELTALIEEANTFAKTIKPEEVAE